MNSAARRWIRLTFWTPSISVIAAFLLFYCPRGAAQPPAERVISLSAGTLKNVDHIVKLACDARKESDRMRDAVATDDTGKRGSAMDRLQEEVYAMLSRRRPSMDETLALMLNLAIGAAAEGDLRQEITERGPRMLAALRATAPPTGLAALRRRLPKGCASIILEAGEHRELIKLIEERKKYRTEGE